MFSKISLWPDNTRRRMIRAFRWRTHCHDAGDVVFSHIRTSMTGAIMFFGAVRWVKGERVQLHDRKATVSGA